MTHVLYVGALVVVVALFVGFVADIVVTYHANVDESDDLHARNTFLVAEARRQAQLVQKAAVVPFPAPMRGELYVTSLNLANPQAPSALTADQVASILQAKSTGDAFVYDPTTKWSAGFAPLAHDPSTLVVAHASAAFVVRDDTS